MNEGFDVGLVYHKENQRGKVDDRSDMVPGSGLKVIFVEFGAILGGREAFVMDMVSNPEKTPCSSYKDLVWILYDGTDGSCNAYRDGMVLCLLHMWSQ